MKALVYAAPEKVELREVPQPKALAGQALLKITSTGICGSDITGFLGHSARRKPPLVLGHEAVAVVQSVGEGGAAIKPGQRVAINPLVSCGQCPACLSGRQNICVRWNLLGMDRVDGTFEEYLAIDARQLHPLPDSFPDVKAVLAEPLANVVHFLRTSLPGPSPAGVAIFGAGTMGALTLALCKWRGLGPVVLVDRNQQRLDTALTLKADAVINSGKEDAAARIRELTGGEGAEYVVDAVGAGAVRKDCVATCRRGGRLLLLGLAENESALPFIDMIRNEQSIHTTFAFTPGDFAEALNLLQHWSYDFTPWTETRSLDEGQASFMKMAKDPGAVLKLVFKL
jgi:threonine dehydrogenase-like Zn-dependent dehydrogenase